jgi:hypothetical protein
MARRQGLFDDLMSIGLKLPWKVALGAAVVIFMTLHAIAIYTQTPVDAKSLADMGAVVQHGFVHVFAEFLQYIIPAGLLIGTSVGYFKQRSRNAAGDSGVATPTPSAPACPRCGLSMVERKARQGKFVGKPFWGCQQYPKCSGIVRIS